MRPRIPLRTGLLTSVSMIDAYDTQKRPITQLISNGPCLRQNLHHQLFQFSRRIQCMEGPKYHTAPDQRAVKLLLQRYGIRIELVGDPELVLENEADLNQKPASCEQVTGANIPIAAEKRFRGDQQALYDGETGAAGIDLDNCFIPGSRCARKSASTKRAAAEHCHDDEVGESRPRVEGCGLQRIL